MKNPCKRIAQRITETVNLSYQKFDHRPMPDEISSSDVINDSMNISLSESGIAFNSHDKINEGDILRLRILLLSSMTTLNLVCNVVYCRDSNPYETRHHPYRVGGQFLNISTSEQEIIQRHIKHKKYWLWTNYSFWTTLISTALFAPDMLLHTTEELLHHVFELVLHVAHLGFEFLEMGLDHAVEHLFETELHDTQLIVFYTICTLGFVLLGLLLKPFYRFIRNRWLKIRQFSLRKAASIRYYWNHQSLIGKFKLVGITSSVIGLYIMFGF